MASMATSSACAVYGAADRTGRSYEGRDLPGHVDVEVGQGDDDVRGERYMEPVATADIELKMMPGSFSSGDDLWRWRRCGCRGVHRCGATGRPLAAFADRQVDCASRARHERDDSWLVSLADDPQNAVTTFEPEVLDVRPTCLTDPQAFKPSSTASAACIGCVPAIWQSES